MVDWRYFEPSKISVMMLAHQLDVQQVHLSCIEIGLTYISGQSLGSREERDKIPDCIIKTPKGTIAVEVERTMKTKRRYDAIVYHYLQAINAGDYQKILYVVPNDMLRKSLKKVIHNMEQVTMLLEGGRQIRHKLEQWHLDFFEFVSMDKLTNILKSVKK